MRCPSPSASTRADAPDAVDVPLDVVAAERLSRAQRRLEVDPRPAVEGSEARPVERLRHGVERELVAAGCHDRQADAVDRDRVAELRHRRRRPGPRSSAGRPPARPRRETTVRRPLGSDPVNTSSRRRRATRPSRARPSRAAALAGDGRRELDEQLVDGVAAAGRELVRPDLLELAAQLVVPELARQPVAQSMTIWSSVRWESGLVDIRLEEHVVADPPGREMRQRARGG